MSNLLERVQQNSKEQKANVVIYGPAGSGKTTFAAASSKPIFVITEQGLGIHDVPHLPLITSFEMIIEYLQALISEVHLYETVVIDSIDWLEPLVWAHVAKQQSVKSIEDLSYGKGYILATDYWRKIIALLSDLRVKRNMMTILISHAQVKRYDSPELEPYDRYTLKLHHRASALIEEWSDILLFANFQATTVKTDVGFGNSVVRGVGTGRRNLYLEERPAFIAKNRYGLPPILPLSWAEFSAALAAAKSKGATK